MPMFCNLKVQVVSSCTERNPIRRRTQSNRTANAIQSGGERNPIGRRSVHDGNHKAFTLPPHPLHR